MSTSPSHDYIRFVEAIRSPAPVTLPDWPEFVHPHRPDVAANVQPPDPFDFHHAGRMMAQLPRYGKVVAALTAAELVVEHVELSTAPPVPTSSIGMQAPRRDVDVATLKAMRATIDDLWRWTLGEVDGAVVADGSARMRTFAADTNSDAGGHGDRRWEMAAFAIACAADFAVLGSPKAMSAALCLTVGRGVPSSNIAASQDEVKARLAARTTEYRRWWLRVLCRLSIAAFPELPPVLELAAPT